MANTTNATKIDDVIAATARARTAASKNIEGIRAVTERLRILAMNALIEAGRAGEMGRGFSVVAQEVKAVSLTVNNYANELSKDLGGEIAALEEMARAMASNASGLRLVDLALNAIELMDRNLYERTCDVRWWATDAAVVDAAATPSREACAYASKRLGVILKAYTVYLDLWLCDLSGQVIANGRPNTYPVTGKSVADRSWFRSGIKLADGDSYAVAEVQREPLLESSQVATYVASVRENGEANGRPIGLLAIHFDWQPQAHAIVNGVHLTDEEKSRTRALLTDKNGLVLASSDGNGVLTERLGFDFKGRVSGYEMDASSTIFAFHKTPGYETYAGQNWYGVITQKDGMR